MFFDNTYHACKQSSCAVNSNFEQLALRVLENHQKIDMNQIKIITEISDLNEIKIHF